MNVLLRAGEETWVVTGVQSFQVETKHGLDGHSIPLDEGTQGFEFVEYKEDSDGQTD